MRKPYETDWVNLPDGVQFSPSKELWYANGKVYDERSANHNGITGMGADLRRKIKQITEEKL